MSIPWWRCATSRKAYGNIATGFSSWLSSAAQDAGADGGRFLTLTLGIGANTAIFSVFKHVFLRPFPTKSVASRLAEQLFAALERFDCGHSDFPAPRNQAHSFSDLAAYNEGELNLTGVGDPERIHAAYTSARYSPAGGSTGTGTWFAKKGETPEIMRLPSSTSMEETVCR